MAINRKQKEEAVAAVQHMLEQSKGTVFANFEGLSVAESRELRERAREAGVSVIVAKKTLLGRAYAAAGLTDVDPRSWSGGIAGFFSSEDEVAPAQVVAAYAKTHEPVKLVGGVLDGHFIDVGKVAELAAIPGKTELLARTVGSLQSPIRGLVNICSGNLRALLHVLNAVQAART